MAKAAEKRFWRHVPVINKSLIAFVRSLKDIPGNLEKAMLYSLKSGGKRIRPILLMESYELFGGSGKKALPAACALEMIHTYSLIHDDLPSMDNDDLRRGKPTNHKVFGENVAILAGDALLTNAFSVLGLNGDIEGIKPENVLSAMRILSKYAGAGGMVGGQIADIKAEGFPVQKRGKAGGRLLDYIHNHKTADLMRAAVEIGAVLADAPGEDVFTLSNYARHIGLAFQIIDDMLDVVGDKKKLGKKGSDAANKKLTYASFYGIERSRRKAAELVKKAHENLRKLKSNVRPADNLHFIADFIIQRDR